MFAFYTKRVVYLAGVSSENQLQVGRDSAVCNAYGVTNLFLGLKFARSFLSRKFALRLVRSY